MAASGTTQLKREKEEKEEREEGQESWASPALGIGSSAFLAAAWRKATSTPVGNNAPPGRLGGRI